MRWLKNKMRNSLDEIESGDDMFALINNTNAKFAIFHKSNFSKQSFEEYKEFVKASYYFDDIDFYTISKPDPLAIVNLPTKAKILLSIEGETHLFNETITKESASAFINENKKPLVIEMNDLNVDDVLSEETYNQTLITMYFPSEVSKDDLKEDMKRLARENRDSHMSYAILSLTEELGKHMCEFLGVEAKLEDDGIIAIISVENSDYNKYIHKGKVNFLQLKHFLAEFKARNLQKHVKSEHPMAENSDSVILKWIGATFHKNVEISKYDLLVFFHAPWDIHCQEIMKYFPILADKMKDSNPNVKLVTVDATLNDVEGYPVESYPVFYFIRADKKDSPIKYPLKKKGEKAIAEFIKMNTSFNWKEIAVEERLADRNEEDFDKDEL